MGASTCRSNRVPEQPATRLQPRRMGAFSGPMFITPGMTGTRGWVRRRRVVARGGRPMKAAWYERQGAPREVLVVGEMPDPHPGPGEVRIRIAASGINPGDVKKRQDAFRYGMPFPRVIPHSDGAGQVDEVGAGVA